MAMKHLENGVVMVHKIEIYFLYYKMDAKLFGGFFAEYFAAEDGTVENLPSYAKNIHDKLLSWQNSVIELKKWPMLCNFLTEEERKYTCCEWINLECENNKLTEIKSVLRYAVKKNRYLLNFIEINIAKIGKASIKSLVHEAAIYNNDEDLMNKYSGGASQLYLFPHSILSGHLVALKYLYEKNRNLDNTFEENMLVLASSTKNIDVIKICTRMKYEDTMYMNRGKIYTSFFINFRDKITELIPDWEEKQDNYMLKILQFNILQNLPIELFCDIINYIEENKINVDFTTILTDFDPIEYGMSGNDEIFNTHKIDKGILKNVDIKLLEDKLRIIFNKCSVVEPDTMLHTILASYDISIDLFKIVVNHANFDIDRFYENIFAEKMYLNIEKMNILIDKGFWPFHIEFIPVLAKNNMLLKYIIEESKVDSAHDNIVHLFESTCLIGNVEQAMYLYDKFKLKNHVRVIYDKVLYRAMGNKYKMYEDGDMLIWLAKVVSGGQSCEKS
jgi:hypothetical protein